MSHALTLQADGKISDKDFATILSGIKRQSSPNFQHIHIDFDEISKEQMQELTQAIQTAVLTSLEMAFTVVDEESAKAFQEAVSKNPQIARVKLILGTPLFYNRSQALGDINKDLDMGFNKHVIIDCLRIEPEQVALVADKVKACGVTDLTLTVREIDPELAESLAQAVTQIETLQKMNLSLGEFTVTKDLQQEDVIEQFANMMITTVETKAGHLAASVRGAASDFLAHGRSFMSSFSMPFAQCMAAQPDDEQLALMDDPEKQKKAALGKLA